MVGQAISHYKIVEKLGEGGMGVVYKAEDTNLDRTVALKFLAAHLLESEEHKQRFLREAKAAASLDHPNICMVHEVGEADGHVFLAMGYVDGQEVRAKIQERPLKLDEALDIAIQAAEGLHAAHQKGIVHRDIKSSNLMLTSSGQVKIMDFGLAQLTGGSRLTRTDTILGTPAYMSPEQAQRLATDRRTDIWSLGVVLYEMVTGRLPFEGEREQAVLYSIINEPHEPVTAIRAGVPLELDRILNKSLAKKPAERYQHLDDMLVDLRALRAKPLTGSQVAVAAQPNRRKVLWMAGGVAAAALALALGLNPGGIRDRVFGGAGAAPIASIAVLPLENFSGDPEQEYFNDGLTDALITDLAKIGGLKVISRSSVMRYKGTDKPLPEIARELGVDAVIEGSAQRMGDELRMTAQLIDPQTASHLWAESYSRGVSEVLQLSGEVALAIAERIDVTLTPEQERRLAGARELNPKVYEAYLRGMFYLNQGSPESIRKGLDHLREAIEKDPADPLAYAGLALGYSQIASHGPWSPDEAFTLAKGAAMQALRLDETLAEAHEALAQIALYRDWDWPAAEQAFERALELNPSLPVARVHYGWYLNLMGRQEEAVAEIEQAHQLDPLNPLFATWIGDVHWAAGEYDKAIEAFQSVLEVNPNFPWALRMLGFAYHGKGLHQEAMVFHEKAAARDPGSQVALAHSYALAGRTDEARKIAAEAEDEPGPNQQFFLAGVYAALGEEDEAFRWLEVAYEKRNPFTPWLKAPLLNPLRDDPRFAELLRKLNLPPL